MQKKRENNTEKQKKARREYGYRNRCYIRVNISNAEMDTLNMYLSTIDKTISPYIKSLINADMKAHNLPAIFTDGRRKKDGRLTDC